MSDQALFTITLVLFVGYTVYKVTREAVEDAAEEKVKGAVESVYGIGVKIGGWFK